MKAEAGDVVREKITGKGLIGRVIAIDPVRKWANIQLRDRSQLMAEHEYDVVFRRGVEEDEPTLPKPFRAKRAVLVDAVVVDQVTEASAELPSPAELEPELQ